MRRENLLGKRSDCPVNFAVEALGDKWSLVILRDIVFWGKHTYKAFLGSDERIATNILSQRLDQLVNEGFITRTPDPQDKRRDLFYATEKTIALIPMFIEMIAWSAHDQEWQALPHAPTPQQSELVGRCISGDRAVLAAEIAEKVRGGGYAFDSENDQKERPERVRPLE